MSKPKHPGGRPTSYRAEFCQRLVALMRACWVEHLRQCADLANLADRDLPEDRIWCRWLKIPEDDREPEHQRI